MRSKKARFGLFALMIGCLCGQTAARAETTGQEKIQASKTEFRVCADPDNLPFTNRKGEGFENKIAEVLARSAHQPLVYYWWPSRRGFITNTLNAWECDVVMGVPAHTDLVRTTQPYYCSRYVMVHRSEQDIAPSLSSPDIEALHIGVVEHTPPLDVLIQRNLNLTVYFTNYDDQYNRPGQIVADVATGKIDVAVVWGPIGGFFARHQAPPLSTTMLEDSTGPRLTFPISAGVRRFDKERSAYIGNLTRERATEIQAILNEYGVPVVDDPDHCPTFRQRGGYEPVSAVQPPSQRVAQVANDTVSDQNDSAAPERLAQQTVPPKAPDSGDIHCTGTETMDDIQKLAGGSTNAASATQPPYTVQNGQVDAKTYTGWIRFAAFCQQCHGVGGVGSEIAPDLVQAIKSLNNRQFETIVSCGLKGNLGTGVMPAWGDNPNIRPYIENLWAYLKARSDGGLGAGRPEKLSSSK